MNEEKSNYFQIFEELVKSTKWAILAVSENRIRRQILTLCLEDLGMCPLGGSELPSPGQAPGEAGWLLLSGTLWKTFLHWDGRLD